MDDHIIELMKDIDVIIDDICVIRVYSDGSGHCSRALTPGVLFGFENRDELIPAMMRYIHNNRVNT